MVLKSTQTKYLQLRSLYRRETCKESIGQRKTSRANSACGQLSAANEGPTVLADSSVQRMRGQQCLADSSVQRMRGQQCLADSSVQRMRDATVKNVILYTHSILYIHAASLLTNNGCVGPEVVLESFRKSTQTRYVQLRSRRRETCKDYTQRRTTSRNWNVTLRALS